EPARLRREVAPDLHQRHQLPVVRERGIAGAQGVGDAPPLLDRRVAHVAAVDDVPDERADHPEALPARARPGGVHRAHPCPCGCARVATAPTAAAVPRRAPGTIRHASTAGRNARRRTSARIGSNSASPACVTPPASTTTSGLKML